jgi:hypothetical protein
MIEPNTGQLPPVPPGDPTRSVRVAHKRKRPRVIAAAVAVVLAGAGSAVGLAASGSSAPSYRLTEATTGSVTESVTATGTIEPTDTANLSFGSSGTVKNRQRRRRRLREGRRSACDDEHHVAECGV